MSFHLAAYFESLGAAAVDSDIDALADPVFSRRNGHYIFTELYSVILAGYFAANAVRARYNVPTLNGIARMQLWPLERSVTIPDEPQLMDMRDYPMALPLNEEIAIEGTNDAVGADPTSVLLWLAPNGWTRNMPRGIQRMNVRFTAAAAGIANSWSLDTAITFAENLKGGWYAVIGCQLFDAGVQAYRFNFPRSTVVNGRKLYPGGLATEAIGTSPNPIFLGGLGEWGRFHSFEPPQIQILANATGASIQEGRLDVVYLGDNG